MPAGNWGSTESICLLQDAAASKCLKGKIKQVVMAKLEKKKQKEKYYCLWSQGVPANILSVGFHILLLMLDWVYMYQIF